MDVRPDEIPGEQDPAGPVQEADAAGGVARSFDHLQGDAPQVEGISLPHRDPAGAGTSRAGHGFRLILVLPASGVHAHRRETVIARAVVEVAVGIENQDLLPRGQGLQGCREIALSHARVDEGQSPLPLCRVDAALLREAVQQGDPREDGFSLILGVTIDVVLLFSSEQEYLQASQHRLGALEPLLLSL